MKKNYLALTLGPIIISTAILFSACRKINTATELGSDLIPAVDNINTFETVLDVQAFNDTFGIANDSTRFSASYEAFLGRINSDPFFGKTDAKLFFELKPTSYPFYFVSGVSPANLRTDSIVLVLDYLDTYGDTLTPQTINVYELDRSNDIKTDSDYLIRESYFTFSNLLGSKTFTPDLLNDSVKVRGDTTKHQLRIELDKSFGDRLLHYDSTSSTVTGAYYSDSAFRTKFKGFALESIGSGDAVMGFNLAGDNTKLAVYYKYAKTSGGDTVGIAYFTFTSFSFSANAIKRDYSGTPVATAAKGTTPAPFVYIQNTPGTFATIKIPGLANLSNRVVHRAELIAEEVYDPSDIKFPVPTYLYLDAYDPAISRYRSIPYDFVYDPTSGSTNLESFGASPVNAVDGSGKIIKVWHFNISRYIQHVLTQTQPAYDLRLYAPFITTNQYGTTSGATGLVNFLVNPTIVKGRVRLAGNTGVADLNPHKMRLRIVYSKL